MDAGAHGLDDARGEGLVDQAAQAGVIGRVGVQQALGGVVFFERAEVGALLGRQVGHGLPQPARVGEVLVVAKGDEHVVVARNDPGADGLAPVDRRCGLQPAQEGIGVV